MVPWGEQASAGSLLLQLVPLVPESPEMGKKRLASKLITKERR